MGASISIKQSGSLLKEGFTTLMKIKKEQLLVLAFLIIAMVLAVVLPKEIIEGVNYSTKTALQGNTQAQTSSKVVWFSR